MDRPTDRTNERDAAKGNHRIKVEALAREILCNASGVMTMAEAVAKAEAILAAEHAATIEPRTINPLCTDASIREFRAAIGYVEAE